MTVVERRPRWGLFMLATGLVLVGVVVLVGPGGPADERRRPGPTAPPDDAVEAPAGTVTTPQPATPVDDGPVPAELRIRTGSRSAGALLQGVRLAVAAGDRLWVLDAASGERVGFRLPGDELGAMVARRSGVVVLVDGFAHVVRDPDRYPVVPPALLAREQADGLLAGTGEDDVWLVRRDRGGLVLTPVDVASRRPAQPLRVTFDGDVPLALAVTDAGVLVTVGDHEDPRVTVVDPSTGAHRLVLSDPGWFVTAGGDTMVGRPLGALDADDALVLTDLVTGASRRVAADERVTAYHPEAAVSPDGRLLAVVVSVADSVLGRDRQGLALVDVDRGEVRAVAAHAGWGAGPAWTVDGRLVLGLHALPLDHGRFALSAWRAVGGFVAVGLPAEVRQGSLPLHVAALWPPDLAR